MSSRQLRRRELRFVVKINTETGPLYLRVDRTGAHIACRGRTQATEFETRGIAEVVSNYFWEQYWDRGREYLKLESREVVMIEKRKERS